MPRARRPVNARVSTVAVRAQVAPVDLAGARFGAAKERRPSWAAAAPAASTPATSLPLMSPPVATRARWAAQRDLGEQVEQRGRFVVVVDEGARWPPASRALDDERICAAAGGRRRLVDIGHRHPDSGAGALAALDRGLVRTSERERHDSGRAASQKGHFGVVVVVVELSCAELDAGRRGQRPQRLAVGADRISRRRGPRRAEQVHAIRSLGTHSNLPDPGVELVRREIAGGEESEPAGVAHGGRQCRRRGSTGERGEHDRTIPTVDVQPHDHFITTTGGGVSTA